MSISKERCINVARKINKAIMRSDINKNLKECFNESSLLYKDNKCYLNEQYVDNKRNLRSINPNKYTEDICTIERIINETLNSENVNKDLKLKLLESDEFNFNGKSKTRYFGFYLVNENEDNTTDKTVILPNGNLNLIPIAITNTNKLEDPSSKESSNTKKELFDDLDGKNDTGNAKVYTIDPTKDNEKIEKDKEEQNSSDEHDKEIDTKTSDEEDILANEAAKLGFFNKLNGIKFNYQDVQIKKYKLI